MPDLLGSREFGEHPFLMKQVESHPGVPLITHLREVAGGCRAILESRKMDCDVPKECLADIGYIMGCVHDIAKATVNFQVYLASGGKKVIPPKHHALLSAYATKEATTQFLAEKWAGKLPEYLFDLLPFLAFTAVKRHHGNLLDFSDELAASDKNQRDLKIQINNFYETEAQAILHELFEKIQLVFDWQKFKNYIGSEKYVNEYGFFGLELESKIVELTVSQAVQYFYLHQLLFSALLHSDKADVILEKRRPDLPEFDFDAIRRFRQRKGFDKPGSELNEKKNQAFSESLEFLEKNFDPKQHLYSVTLPTGLGKTLASLAIAMKMRQMLQNPVSRIVITIPFTSIIDQNYQVFQEVFENPTSDVLLKHHHLSEPDYKTAEDDILDNQESKFLIETWQSGLVVTTFVQLLECVFTNNKSKLLKFPNLANAIIVLDEVQSIKYELWEAVRDTFRVLGENLNCYFILMSATQPLIFTPGKEIVELIPDYKQYFRLFNRTKLVNRTQNLIKFDDFCIEIQQYHETNPEKNILVILNTKKITRLCFQNLSEVIPENKANLYFLSTYITPFERKIIIQRIKEKGNRLPNIIISTQLIEAGVDISMHAVFRSIAPMDSIIQATGRANRYDELGILGGEIFLYEIEELKRGSSMVYGSELLQKTKQVLENVEVVEESQYLGLIDAYFQKVRMQSDNIESELLKHVCNLDFEKVGEFSFIEERRTESVFVQLNEDAKAVWEKYVSIATDQTMKGWDRKAAFAKIKGKFYDFVINVGVDFGKKQIEFDSEPEHCFYVSKFENPSKCYQFDYLNDGSIFRKNTGYDPVKKHSFFDS